MGIRITDQPADQQAQNPPPEHDTAADQPQSKSVSGCVEVTADFVPTVLRGVSGHRGLTFLEQVDLNSALPVATGAAGPASDDCDPVSENADAGTIQTLLISTAAVGWVRRESGAKEHIGGVDDQQVRKSPPRWTIAPTSVATEISADQTVRIANHK